MKNTRALLLVSGLIAFSSVGHAGLLIEPHIGYNITGSTSSKSLTVSNATGTYSDSYHGPQYGARLGYQYLGLMGGFSYNHASYTLKKVNNATATSVDSKRNDMGVFVGFNAPILFRAWLGYSFSVKETKTTSGDYDKGSATELGLGFTGLPFLSINLEYKMIDYKTFHNDSAGTDSTYSPNRKTNEVVLSVSAPLNFF